jgi:NAD(P)H-dependent FMN reductase
MGHYTVGYFVGSLSRSSLNRLLAKALVRLAPPELDLREISLEALPLYNRDHDDDYPPVARAFKDAIAAVDAVLFVTPEYNRSIPGVLKNAIDWRADRTARIRSRASRLRSSALHQARSARPWHSNTSAASSASATHRR